MSKRYLGDSWFLISSDDPRVHKAIPTMASSVEAKSENQGGGLFEFEDTTEIVDDAPILPRTAVKLNGVKARVDRVHVDGLKRTCDDIVKYAIDDMFHATDFEDVIMTAHKVRSKLEALGCFKDIGVFIDVSSGPEATPEGLEVTFQVRELTRIVGGVNTTVGENEGNLVVGVKLPNVAGRGERVAAEYSMGYRSTSNFSITTSKPYMFKPLSPVVSASVYQQNHEYPWSGYKLLDRGVLLDVAFKTSPATKHNLQWEGLVRDTSVINKTTSFRVRESSGPQMKSAIRHIVAVDHRDEPIFPTKGTHVQFSCELSGLGGSMAFLKSELQTQANMTVLPKTVLQVTGSLGILHDIYGTELPEHFYLGGATSLRGFTQRGAGPHADDQAVGGRLYWASGVHLYTPLPFQPGKGGIGEFFRSHFFVNAGSLLAHEQATYFNPSEWITTARVTVGAGVALRVGSVARFELNYCVPVRAVHGDTTAPGIQFGVGANFL